MRLVAFLLILIFKAAPTATQVIPLSIEELISHSQLVVRGTVLSKSCQRDTEGRIYTKVELQISEVWKGSHSGTRLTVVHGGGTLGEDRVHVQGQVDYRIGQDAVVFMVRNPRGEAVTLAMAQGKFDVWKNDLKGEFLANNPFHGRAPKSGGSGSETALEKTGQLTLAELRTRVRREDK